jgi:hypothetical protein
MWGSKNFCKDEIIFLKKRGSAPENYRPVLQKGGGIGELNHLNEFCTRCCKSIMR